MEGHFSNVAPDATDEILDENEFNEPPEDGFQYFMYQIDATYEGAESAFVTSDLEFGVYFNSTVYTEYCWAEFPNDISVTPEVYAGGVASGNHCVVVPTDGVEDAVLAVEDYWSDTSTRYFVDAG